MHIRAHFVAGHKMILIDILAKTHIPLLPSAAFSIKCLKRDGYLELGRAKELVQYD